MKYKTGIIQLENKKPLENLKFAVIPCMNMYGD